MNYKLIIFSVLILFFTVTSLAQDNLMSHQIGAVREIRQVGHVIHIITDDRKEVQFSVYAPAIIRVKIAPPDLAMSPSYAVTRDSGLDFNKMDNGEKEITLITDSLKIVVQKDPLRIDFYNAAGEWLDGDAPSLGVSWQGEEVTSYRKLTVDEKFIGLGEKTGPLNRREQSYVNWNTDAPGYGLNADPLYSTFPYFMGIHPGSIFGIFFDNSYRSFFNFGGSTDGKMYFFGADGGAMNYYFLGASTVSGQIKDYTWLTGRMEMPPLWSLGYQQCRYSYMSQQQLLDIANRMRQDSIPCDAIYCDIDYMNGYRIFTWNPVTYSHPKALSDSLKAMGMHLITIIDPGIKIDSNGYRPYIAGMKGNYFARYPDGKPYTGSVWAGRSHFPDFTRDAVRKWWGENFKVLVDAGVTGFWNDMNEPSAWGQDIPPLIEFGEGKNTVTLKEARNIYGMQMARATFEGTRSLLNGHRPFVLTRAAYSGIQRYSAMWTGDNNPTDDHMLLAYRMINSMGLTGEAFDGVDIGGFTGNPTPDLMVRWMSLGVYTPMFRNHTAKGNTSHEPWAWGERNEELMRHFIQTRYRLLPYLYSAFYETTQTGMPVNRTLAIDYTHNDEVYDPRFENEFLFGPSMLVAPVASTDKAEQVYLPAGTWYRFGRDDKYEGNKVFWASSPLSDLPVFIKAGAIIPMQNVIQSTSDKGDNVMYLNIWFGDDPSSFTYYEDDGTTYNYKQGRYYERSISFSPEDHEIALNNVKGDFDSRFLSVELILHDFPAGSGYTVNGQPAKTGARGTIQTVSFPNEKGK
ncbi:MAG: glycoside hydrolase family 31 protein, partial [Bacteroidales bacterium]